MCVTTFRRLGLYYMTYLEAMISDIVKASKSFTLCHFLNAQSGISSILLSTHNVRKALERKKKKVIDLWESSAKTLCTSFMCQRPRLSLRFTFFFFFSCKRMNRNDMVLWLEKKLEQPSLNHPKWSKYGISYICCLLYFWGSTLFSKLYSIFYIYHWFYICVYSVI